MTARKPARGSSKPAAAEQPDEDVDAEVARIEAEAEEAKAAARQRSGGRKPATRTGRPASRPADDGPDTLSWDEFWDEVKREEADEQGEAPTTVIRGVEVVIPHDLPLKFDRMLEEVEDSESDTDIETLVADLFGDDVYEEWVENGMGSDELRVALLWGIGNGRGRALTFADAYQAVKTEGKSLAPPQNRTDRRASARSGGRSNATSGGSTTSRRGR